MKMFVILGAFAFIISLTAGAAPGTRSNMPLLDGRIVGGRDTTIEEHPYQVSLQLYDSHKCGGSIMTPTKIVTAAHCTYMRSPSKFTVRAGSTQRSFGGELRRVSRINQHPKYNANTQDYDVSVLTLDVPFEFGNKVNSIPLQYLGQEVSEGVRCTVTGWGSLQPGGVMPENLQEVQVPKISDQNCKLAYPNGITDRMACFGEQNGGKDACQGDSGGPLVCNGAQAAIVSWGYGCDARYPGVYSKVTNLEIHSFIILNILV